MNERLAHIERGVDEIYNSSHVQHKLIVRLAEFGHKKHKTGAVRTATLFGVAARAAAPNLQPLVQVTVDHADPTALFRREELFDRLGGDSPPSLPACRSTSPRTASSSRQSAPLRRLAAAAACRSRYTSFGGRPREKGWDWRAT
ncbi:hypothetical protein AURDEDRAFT_172647 [Auricularia subglabra TFB-10046 SS5]|nr:hypothetical protein AURDEDRAFT_172647 [Auricularia subglabra TFB-10046 SS5]